MTTSIETFEPSSKDIGNMTAMVVRGLEEAAHRPSVTAQDMIDFGILFHNDIRNNARNDHEYAQQYKRAVEALQAAYHAIQDQSVSEKFKRSLGAFEFTHGLSSQQQEEAVEPIIEKRQQSRALPRAASVGVMAAIAASMVIPSAAAAAGDTQEMNQGFVANTQSNTQVVEVAAQGIGQASVEMTAPRVLRTVTPPPAEAKDTRVDMSKVAPTVLLGETIVEATERMNENGEANAAAAERMLNSIIRNEVATAVTNQQIVQQVTEGGAIAPEAVQTPVQSDDTRLAIDLWNTAFNAQIESQINRPELKLTDENRAQIYSVQDMIEILSTNPGALEAVSAEGVVADLVSEGLTVVDAVPKGDFKRFVEAYAQGLIEDPQSIVQSFVGDEQQKIALGVSYAALMLMTEEEQYEAMPQWFKDQLAKEEAARIAAEEEAARIKAEKEEAARIAAEEEAARIKAEKEQKPTITGWGLGAGDGHELVYYEQTDSRWAQDTYAYNGVEATNETMAYCGCGPTSFAMAIATMTGRDVDPTDLAKFMINLDAPVGPGNCASRWVWDTDPGVFLEAYGVRIERIESTDAAFTDTIENGGMVFMSQQGPSRFAKTGHLMLVTGMVVDGDETRYLVGDPSPFNGKEDSANLDGFTSEVIFGNGQPDSNEQIGDLRQAWAIYAA